MTEPLKPTEVGHRLHKLMPPKVIEIWNQEILKNWTGDEAIVDCTVVRNKLVQANVLVEGFHYNDGVVKAVYTEAGWMVLRMGGTKVKFRIPALD